MFLLISIAASLFLSTYITQASLFSEGEEEIYLFEDPMIIDWIDENVYTLEMTENIMRLVIEEELEAMEIERERQKEEEEEKERQRKIERENNAKKQEQPVNSLKVATANSGGGWETYVTTYYTADCKGCSGITTSGIDVRKTIYSNGYRIVAVDPNKIKLGTLVEVQTPYETFTAIAADTGGAIKGNKIDILVSNKETAYKLGRHKVSVRILK